MVRDRAGRTACHRLLERPQAPLCLGSQTAPSRATSSRYRSNAEIRIDLADAPLNHNFASGAPVMDRGQKDREARVCSRDVGDNPKSPNFMAAQGGSDGKMAAIDAGVAPVEFRHFKFLICAPAF